MPTPVANITAVIQGANPILGFPMVTAVGVSPALTIIRQKRRTCMSIYTQDNSDIQIIVDGKNDKDELGNDLVLLAEILEGSFEALSEPFCIELKLLSPAAVPPLDMKE